MCHVDCVEELHCLEESFEEVFPLQFRDVDVLYMYQIVQCVVIAFGQQNRFSAKDLEV